KLFYTFKQYSAFIHPGWKRSEASIGGNNAVSAAFINPAGDSATLIVINRSLTDDLVFKPQIQGKTIDRADLYVTSATENCEYKGNKYDDLLSLPPKSIATVSLILTEPGGPIVPVSSISLRPEAESISNRLGTMQINPMVLPSNATDKALYWEITENNQIADITQDGLVTANGTGDGKVTIRATATDGSGMVADTFIMLTNQVWMESITVSPSDPVIDEPLGSIQLSAEVLPEEAFKKDLIWQIINDHDIAAITQDGLLRAKGTGDGLVQIRVSSTDGSGINTELTAEISNQFPVTDIRLSAADTVINEFMGSMQIDAVIIPENASSKTLQWSVIQGKDLASIDQSGMLTATGDENGQVTVTAASYRWPDIFGEITIALTNQGNSVQARRQALFSVWYANGLLHYIIPVSAQKRKIYIHAADGRLVMVKDIGVYAGQGEIDCSAVPSGIYVITLDNNESGYWDKVCIY
ncbi:MAG TPA: Ig-like domain-containing protein, partial [Bacteroidales bacterium]|nr:Ig-like domain-containing protein [Bacteroidales bacterium]